MDCDSQTSTELLYVQNKPIVRNNEYMFDLWRELSKRWMVVGVLLVMTLAVLAPKVGAPGGPLHTDYVSYLPLLYVYYACGSRSPARAAPVRLHALVCVHAHVVTPAVAVVVITVLRDITDYRIIKGALFASIGGPCLWLSAAVSPHPLTAPLLFGSWLGSWFLVPLSIRVLCGRVTLPPLTATLTTLLSTVIPYCVGVVYPTHQDPNTSKLCALVLLYVESCETLRHAEGVLYMSDVLVVIILELTHLVTSAATCWVYSRCDLIPEHQWRLVAACSVPKGYMGGVFGSSCDIWGLSSVPTAMMVPLRAALLAALPLDDEQ